MGTRTEITVEETEGQRRFVSWSPRKNDLGGHGEPLTDWLPTMGDVGMKAEQGKVSTVRPPPASGPTPHSTPGFLKVPEASASSWTPGTSWNPGKALAEALFAIGGGGWEETHESMKIQQMLVFHFCRLNISLHSAKK